MAVDQNTLAGDPGEDDTLLWDQWGSWEDGGDLPPDDPADADGLEDEAADEAAENDEEAEEGEALSGEDWGDEDPEDFEEKSDEGDHITDDERAELDRLRHYRSSQEGRISAYQQQIAAMQAELAKAKATTEPPEIPEHMKQLAEEYPDIAPSVIKETAGIKDQVEQMAAQMNLMRRSQVDHMAPGGIEYLDEHRAEYMEWLQSQPMHVVQAAQLNAEQIVDPYSAVKVIKAFIKETGGQPDSEPPPDGGKSQSLARRRKRQMEAAAAPKPKGAPSTQSELPPSGATDQQYWDEWEAKGL
ncbi:MAG: hypothetical protein AAGC92_14270 [Pseudomonadota bacterium]